MLPCRSFIVPPQWRVKDTTDVNHDEMNTGTNKKDQDDSPTKNQKGKAKLWRHVWMSWLSHILNGSTTLEGHEIWIKRRAHCNFYKRKLLSLIIQN